MCTCYRNWMANDCSERICQFGPAHVDTPKGDLDASSGALTGPGTLVTTNSQMYPKGTTEQFPDMVDSAHTVLTNTAHAYMECSNKGICDRQTGTCQCFDGYTGSACQRAACPNTGNGVCSGHGTCETIKTIAAWDYGNMYDLWDEHSTMGCVCDGGYRGANCEEKICKYGADPLYKDGPRSIRYSNWTVVIYTGAAATVDGTYALVFTDQTGEDWQSPALDWDDNCDEIVPKLLQIPNKVFKSGDVLCQKYDAINSLAGADFAATVGQPFSIPAAATLTFKVKYALAFPNHPGVMKNVWINKYLDGSRPTMYTDEATTSTLGWYIYNDGFYGENDDFTPDHCVGLEVTITAGATGDDYDELTIAEGTRAMFKTCLGDVDGNTANNGDVENWESGTINQPHLIKLIDATQDQLDTTLYSVSEDVTHTTANLVSVTAFCTGSWGTICTIVDPPGFYAVVYSDGGSNSAAKFYVFGRPSTYYSSTTRFYVFTTTGYLTAVAPTTTLAFNTYNGQTATAMRTSLFSNILFTHNRAGQTIKDVSCEAGLVSPCLSKGDHFMVINNGRWGSGAWAGAVGVGEQEQIEANAKYPQIYKVVKIANELIPTEHYATSTGANIFDYTGVTSPTFVRTRIYADKSFNVNYYLDSHTGASATTDLSATLFKFTPPSNAYNFAAPCSNRGICDGTTGLCKCFNGFTGDNCNAMDALAN